RRKFDDHETFGRPFAFERLELSAPDDELPAVRRKGRWNHTLVGLIPDEILHLDRNDDVSGHNAPLFRSHATVSLDSSHSIRNPRRASLTHRDPSCDNFAGTSTTMPSLPLGRIDMRRKL